MASSLAQQHFERRGQGGLVLLVGKVLNENLQNRDGHGYDCFPRHNRIVFIFNMCCTITLASGQVPSPSNTLGVGDKED
ncbi:MAG: hypothetical protein K6D59_01630 [Bacteroidales bacterium]|nr:hypothetical protein [Bacteroidales bacterium]